MVSGDPNVEPLLLKAKVLGKGFLSSRLGTRAEKYRFAGVRMGKCMNAGRNHDDEGAIGG